MPLSSKRKVPMGACGVALGVAGAAEFRGDGLGIGLVAGVDALGLRINLGGVAEKRAGETLFDQAVVFDVEVGEKASDDEAYRKKHD